MCDEVLSAINGTGLTCQENKVLIFLTRNGDPGAKLSGFLNVYTILGFENSEGEGRGNHCPAECAGAVGTAVVCNL